RYFHVTGVQTCALPISQISDIAGYNVGRGQVAGFQPYTVNDVYQVFVRSLTSDAVRTEFFEKVVLPANDSVNSAELWKKFNDRLQVKDLRSGKWRVRSEEHTSELQSRE